MNMTTPAVASMVRWASGMTDADVSKPFHIISWQLSLGRWVFHEARCSFEHDISCKSSVL